MCMPPALPLPKSTPTPVNSDWLLSKVELSIPAIFASETLTRYGKCEEVDIKLGAEHQLKLVFNQQQQGESMNFKPDLPLVIEW